MLLNIKIYDVETEKTAIRIYTYFEILYCSYSDD